MLIWRLHFKGTYLRDHTIYIELFSDSFELRDTVKCHGEVMYISTIEALTGLDKIKVMLADLSVLDRFLLLRRLAELIRGKQSTSKRRLLVGGTYRTEKLAEPIVELQMGVPKSMFHRFLHRELKIMQDDGLTSLTIPSSSVR